MSRFGSNGSSHRPRAARWHTQGPDVLYTSTCETLAALEAAQHTVYADFGIPMGSTEVVVWRTQSEFQRYTSMFSSQGASEFVAALTLRGRVRDGEAVGGSNPSEVRASRHS